MNKSFLMAASALALMVSMPVQAQETRDNLVQQQTFQDQNMGSNHDRNQAANTARTQNEANRSGQSVGERVSAAAESVESGIKGSFENIRAAVMDERSGRDIRYTEINTRHTVDGILGQNVRNANGENIAEVEDIIFDQNGDAQLVILADGGFMGMGEKKVAFDYADITRKNADGDVIMPLTEEMLDRAAEFSTDRDERRADVRTMPQNAVSAEELLDAKILDNNGNEVADVEDIVLGAGGADRVIVAFDEVLGMGGERAVFAFDDLRLTRADDELHFQLSAAQSSRFEAYREGMKRSQ